MDKLNNSFAIEKIVLQLKFPELGALIESLKHLSTQYDFFSAVAMHIDPLIRKSKQFKTLTNRWEREISSSKKELEVLKQKALEEVTAGFNLLAKRIAGNEHIQSTPEVQQTLHTNSASNLLDRANIKGVLRTLFIQKSSRKGSIQLPSAHIQLKNYELSLRLNIEKHIKETELILYPNFIDNTQMKELVAK